MYLLIEQLLKKSWFEFKFWIGGGSVDLGFSGNPGLLQS